MLIDDDVIDFANREMSNVVLSLDGRKEIHDRYRVDYAGNGSWDRIVPKFQRLVKARGGKNYYMRGTFTHQNPDFVQDIRQMLDLGFTELSMEPVVCAPGDPSALTAEDLEIVKQQYEELAALILERRAEGRPFTFYHYMLDLAGGPCIYKRISGCGSGTEYMAVTPWGDLYPCHQFVGEERFRLGDIWNGIDNPKVRAEFAACNVYAKPECRECWARLYCSGGCAANAYHATGSITGVYEAGCELFRKRMECAIMLAAAKAEADESCRRRSAISCGNTRQGVPAVCTCPGIKAGPCLARSLWILPKSPERTSCTHPGESYVKAKKTQPPCSAVRGLSIPWKDHPSVSGPCCISHRCMRHCRGNTHASLQGGMPTGCFWMRQPCWIRSFYG